MKKLLKKFCIYLIPFIVIALLFFLFSPYDYLSLRGYTNYEAKPLTDMRLLMKEQPDSIILGDSRMANLNVDYINEITGEHYVSLAFGGANLGESVALFWFATEHTQLKKVVFGVGWYTSNGEQPAGNIPRRVQEATNPWKFFSSYNNWTFTLHRIRVSLHNFAANSLGMTALAIDDPDPRSLDTPVPQFPWTGTFRQDLYDSGFIIFSNLEDIGYELRQDTLDQLGEVIDYCGQNDIEIIFVFPPMHDVLFLTVTPRLGIDVYREQYKEYLIARATVYDLEFRNAFNSNDMNFVDAFHLTGAGKKWLAEVIFTDLESPYIIRYIQ